MDTLRAMIAREPVGGSVYQASDDEVIAQAVHLVTSGAWHIHAVYSPQNFTEPPGNWKQVTGRPVARVPNRKTWRLSAFLGAFRVVRAEDLVQGEAYLEHSSATPLEIATLTRGLGQTAVAEIRDLISASRSTALSLRRSLKTTQGIGDAFLAGLLVLVREQASGGSVADAGQDSSDDSSSGSQNKSKTAGSRKVEPKTWFQMQLLDEDGDPMANEDYSVIDSAGAHRKGKLDSNGSLFIPPILPPGNCVITFPNIHLNPKKRKS